MAIEVAREIIFDTETTGISVADGHKIVEIGAVELVGRIPTGRTFHEYINPGRDIDPEAIRVHGITNEQVADKPPFSAIVDKWIDFVGDAALVAHNATFDMDFLHAEFEACGKERLLNPVIDTLPLARSKFPGARASLDALCNRFGVDLSARTFHGALLDSQLLAEVYVHLTGGLQTGMQFESAEEVETVAQAIADVLPMRAEVLPARTFSFSEEEHENHRAMLAKIKNPLWLQ